MKYRLNNLINLCALFLLFLLTSCAPVYVPNAVNTPLLTEKNQFQIKAGIGLSGTDIQSAYALTDHFAVMANYNFRNNTAKEDENGSKGRLGEAAIGLFFPSPKKAVIYEIYTGFGYGYGKYSDIGSGTFDKSAEGSFNRFFIQQNFAYHFLFVDLIQATRASFVNFYKYNESGFSTALTKNKSAWFIEPTLTLKAGKAIKVYYQVGVTYPAKGNQNVMFDYGDVFAWLRGGASFTNIGIELTIDQKEK